MINDIRYSKDSRHVLLFSHPYRGLIEWLHKRMKEPSAVLGERSLLQNKLMKDLSAGGDKEHAYELINMA